VTRWDAAGCAVHLVGAEVVAELQREAAVDGARVFRVSLTGVADRTALVARLAETFEFPHPVVGLDAASDLMSDLEWLGDFEAGLLVIDATGSGSVTVDLAGVLPGMLDRWRSQGRTFVVVLTGLGDRDSVAAALERANAQLDAAGSLPWAQPGTGRVPVLG